jgi:reactive intermediate/imine deaminase
MKSIITDKMPIAGGHYSMCIEHNGILYISGQLPFKLGTKEIPNGVKAQTLQILQNLDLILAESGSALNKLLQLRIYISDIEMWGDVNKVYSSFMGNNKPARCVVPTRELHYGSLIEIEATAYV